MLCLNALRVLPVSDQWHHVVTLGTVGIAALVVFDRFWKWKPRRSLQLLLLASPLLLRIVVFRDSQGLLYVGALIAAMLALFVISENGIRLSPEVFFLFTILGTIPVTLYSVFIVGGPVGNSKADIAPRFIPLAQNNWRISIAPWGETYHYTSALGVVLLSIGLVLYSRTRAKKHLLILALSAYLLVFSGARIGLITAGVILALFFLNRFKWRPLLSIAVIALGIGTVYGASFIADYVPTTNNELINALAPVSRDSNTDVTSDRSWLWDYHMRLFKENPVLGAGMSSTLFSYGGLIEGHPAPSVDESYYTQIFAAFGLTALSIIFIHAYIVRLSLMERNVLKLLFAATLVVETAGNSMLANLYSPMSFFLFAYICMGRN